MKQNESSGNKFSTASPENNSKLTGFSSGVKSNENIKANQAKSQSQTKTATASNDFLRNASQPKLQIHAKQALPALSDNNKFTRTIGNFKTVKLISGMKEKRSVINLREHGKKEGTGGPTVSEENKNALVSSDRGLLLRKRSKTSSLERQGSEILTGSGKMDALLGVKTFGDRKDISNLLKWYEIGHKQINGNAKYTQEQKFEYLQNIFRMALESIVEGSNEEFPGNEERMKMVSRVWNDNAESLQNYVKAIYNLREEACQENERMKDLHKKTSLLQIELKNSYENIIALQKDKSELTKKIEKLREEMKRKNLDMDSFVGVMLPAKEDILSINAGIKAKADKYIFKGEAAVDTHDLSNLLFIKSFYKLLQKLVRHADKCVWMNPITVVREKFSQTDILDLVSDINNFDISPRKTPAKVGQGTSPLKFRMHQLFFDEDVIQEVETGKINSDVGKGRVFSFRARSFDKSNDLSLDDSSLSKIDIAEISKNYENAIDEFLVKVDLIVSKVRAKTILAEDIQDMHEEINKCKQFTRDVMGLIARREKDSWFQIMNHKIEIAECELVIKDRQRTLENWQRRFNVLFQKHQRTVEILLHENLTTPELRRTADDLKINIKSEYLKDVNYDELHLKKIPSGTPKSGIAPRRISLRTKTNAPVNSSSTSNLNISKTNLRPSEIQNQGSARKDSGSDSEVGFIRKSDILMPVMRFNLQKIFKNVVTVNGNAAIKFIQKLKQVPLKPKEDMKLDLALKIIAAVYTEVFKQGERRENHNPLYFFVFDYLTNRYGGLQRSAESKMISLIRTCLHYQENIKVRMFLKLMTIIEHEPYEMDGWDLNFYLDSMMKLDEENPGFKGLALVTNSKERTLIPLKNALDYATDFFNNEQDFSKVMSLDTLLSNMRKNKIIDEVIIGRILIDADLVVNTVLVSRYEYLLARYKTLFDVLDCQKNGYIDQEQFLLLWRNIKISTYTFEKGKQLYHQEADLMDKETNRVNMSFKQFATFLEKTNLFSTNDISAFYRSRDHHIQNILNLEANWPLKKSYIKLKFIKIRMYNIYFQKMIKSIEDYFYAIDRDDIQDCIWLRYRLVDEESTNGYAETMVEEVLEKRLWDISEAYFNLKSKHKK